MRPIQITIFGASYTGSTNNVTYPAPGSGDYQTTNGGGMSSLGTAYDPGGAVDGIYSASTGWRRVTSLGYWSNTNTQGNDNPGIFGNEYAATVDAYGGFGSAEGADTFAMEWKGYIQASTAASYWNFKLDSDDVAMFWVGNAALNPTQENAYLIANNDVVSPTNSLLLTENKYYPIRMRFQEWSGVERCQVYLAVEGGTANAMITYFNADRLRYNSYTNGHGSINSEILHLGSATTNVYSGSGDWIDSSAAKNNATLVNTPTWLPLDSGGVFQLDGSNYFNVPTLQFYNDQEMTTSIWFNIPADTTVGQTLISKELTFKIRINANGVLQVFGGNGSGWNISPTINSAYTYGEWCNITVSINNSSTEIYKNGQLLTSETGLLLYSNNNFPFNIGAYSNGGDPMTGKVGEVTYYTGVKTAEQVENDFAATAGRYGFLQSLRFVQSQTDYLDVAASSDWSMGTTWTIEWWNKSAKASSAGDLLTVMCQNFNTSGIQILYQNGFQIQGSNIIAPEPVTGVWTHVALVSDGTNLKLYYNGVRVYTGGAWNINNTTDPVRIGARGTATFQRFDGELALIRISNAVKYATTFTPTTTYDVEADTKLFLGSRTPLVDTSASAHTITNTGVSASTNYPSVAGAQSLVFNQPEGDFMSTPASADWNLGNTWTMEFWMNANNSSNAGINIPGGQWGLLNQGGWYGGIPNNSILIGLAGGYLTIAQDPSTDIQFAEPTAGQWTHVAVVNDGGGTGQKVYYNGVEQTKTSGTYQSNGWTNTTADLYIGRLSNQYAGYSSHFDGKMALIRISNAAKYLTTFTPTTTYGVEADTKLFLGSSVPWADTSVSAHFITNNGVGISTSFPT